MARPVLRAGLIRLRGVIGAATRPDFALAHVVRQACPNYGKHWRSALHTIEDCHLEANGKQRKDQSKLRAVLRLGGHLAENDYPPTVKSQSATKSRSVKKAVTWTAIVTFIATALGQYAVERIADRAVSDLVPEVGVDLVGPYNENLSVVVPPTTQFTGVIMDYSGMLANRWAVNNGGGPANDVSATLTVWGNVDRPILVRGIRATNINCQPAPSWEYLPTLGGGDVNERTVQIDLESGDPNAVPVEDELTGETFKFPLQVSRSDIEYFNIDIAVSDSDCTYQLELGYEETLGNVRYLLVGGGPHRLISSARSSENYRWKFVDEDETKVTIERCSPKC